MKVSDLTPIIVALYNANRTGMCWGGPGIGKSASFRAAAKLLKEQLGLTGPVLERHELRAFQLAGGDMRQAFGLFDLRLSQMDPVEVGGLPRENKLNGTMEKLPPSWFAHEARKDLPDFGILLLEELPSAPLSVQTTAYQICLDHVIEDFKLKDGWGCFAAGNRLTDGGQYFKMPDALANRMCHIDVESNMDSWKDWAIDNGVEFSLVAFLSFKPDLLNTHEDKVKNKHKSFAFATERQWEAVNDILVNNNGLDDGTLLAIIGGLVGAGPAAEYIGYRKVYQNMPNIDSVLIDPMSAHLPEDAGSQYAVMTALAARADYNNLKNCLVYTDRLLNAGRPEMSVLFLKDMQRRQKIAETKAREAGQPFQNAVQSPEYAVWASKNRDLFT